MGNKAFIASVLFWKVSGATVWSLVINFIVSRILSYGVMIFGGSYVFEFELLSIFCTPILIYFHILTLKIVPVPAKLLHLKETFYLVIWAMIYAIYSFLLTSAPIPFPYSVCMSSLASLIYFVTQNHAFYINFHSAQQTRFSRFCDNFRSHVILSIIIGSAFIPFVGLINGLSCLFASIQLFFCSDVIFSIATVVASEPASFTSINNKRFIRGLNSHDQLQKYLAFSDLYSISCGNSLRRRFLFRDPSNQVFASIVESCTNLLKLYTNRNAVMLQMGNTKAPIHLVNDSQWRRSQIYRPSNNENEEENSKSNFFSRLLFSSPEKIKKAEQIKREANALEFSTLAMLSVQSLVRLLSILSSEDKFGIGQTYVESILNTLLSAKIALDKTMNYAYISAPYKSGWFAQNPTDLTLKTKKIVDWAVNEILRHFRNQLDCHKLTPDNLNLAEQLIGRKLNHRSGPNHSLFDIY